MVSKVCLLLFAKQPFSNFPLLVLWIEFFIFILTILNIYFKVSWNLLCYHQPVTCECSSVIHSHVTNITLSIIIFVISSSEDLPFKHFYMHWPWMVKVTLSCYFAAVPAMALQSALIQGQLSVDLKARGCQINTIVQSCTNSAFCPC